MTKPDYNTMARLLTQGETRFRFKNGDFTFQVTGDLETEGAYTKNFKGKISLSVMVDALINENGMDRFKVIGFSKKVPIDDLAKFIEDSVSTYQREAKDTPTVFDPDSTKKYVKRELEKVIAEHGSLDELVNVEPGLAAQLDPYAYAQNKSLKQLIESHGFEYNPKSSERIHNQMKRTMTIEEIIEKINAHREKFGTLDGLYKDDRRFAIFLTGYANRHCMKLKKFLNKHGFEYNPNRRAKRLEERDSKKIAAEPEDKPVKVHPWRGGAKNKPTKEPKFHTKPSDVEIEGRKTKRPLKTARIEEGFVARLEVHAEKFGGLGNLLEEDYQLYRGITRFLKRHPEKTELREALENMGLHQRKRGPNKSKTTEKPTAKDGNIANREKTAPKTAGVAPGKRPAKKSKVAGKFHERVVRSQGKIISEIIDHAKTFEGYVPGAGVNPKLTRFCADNPKLFNKTYYFFKNNDEVSLDEAFEALGVDYMPGGSRSQQLVQGEIFGELIDHAKTFEGYVPGAGVNPKLSGLWTQNPKLYYRASAFFKHQYKEPLADVLNEFGFEYVTQNHSKKQVPGVVDDARAEEKISTPTSGGVKSVSPEISTGVESRVALSQEVSGPELKDTPKPEKKKSLWERLTTSIIVRNGEVLIEK